MRSQGSQDYSPTSSQPSHHPSTSHNSLNLQNMGSRAVTRSHSSMSHSSNHMGGSVHASLVGTRSSASMGRNYNKHLNSGKVKKIRSIPTDMDHFTDV
jgi:hypothetical protein